MQYVRLSTLILLGACAHPPASITPAALTLTVGCEVPLAIPNDGLDDRVAIQNALTTQGCAHLLNGVYDIDTPTFVPPARRPYAMLTVTSGNLYGDGPGTLLHFRGDAGFQDWEGVRMTGIGPALHDLSFDTSLLTSTDEQTHASKILGPASGAEVSRVTYNHPVRVGQHGGDCLQMVCYSVTPCTSITIHDNKFSHCDRSGVAVHSGASNLVIQDNEFPDTGNTALDFEGTGDTHNVLIANNRFALSPGAHGVGEIQLQLVDHVRVTGCVLDGRGIDIFQSDDVEIDHNTITLSQPTGTAVVWAHKDSSRVNIHHNEITRALASGTGSVISATPHNSGLPDHLTIADNKITQMTPGNVIDAMGVVGLYVTHNAVVFAGVLGSAYGVIANGSSLTLGVRSTDIVVDYNTWDGKLRGIIGVSGSYSGVGTVSSVANTATGASGGIVCGGVTTGSGITGPVTSTRDSWPAPQCGAPGFVTVAP